MKIKSVKSSVKRALKKEFENMHLTISNKFTSNNLDYSDSFNGFSLYHSRLEEDEDDNDKVPVINIKKDTEISAQKRFLVVED